MTDKRYKIKDIAAMAGVSAGTVDRVIHKRGEVSEQSREAVEQVLQKINYKPNLHVSAIGLKRQITLVVVLPTVEVGGYWEQIEASIKKAIYEFSHINIKVTFLHYNQFDLLSCRREYAKAQTIKCDAMLIGPTFYDETMLLTSRLDSMGTPYVFVDINVSNTRPLGFFGTDADAVGYVKAKLLNTVMDNRKDIAIFRAKRRGDESSFNTIMRENGFMRFLSENCPSRNILSVTYNYADKDNLYKELDDFFAANKNVGGVAVFNSRAYVMADYFRERSMKGIYLIGCGAFERNFAHLREGYVSCLISERPDRQGYLGVKAILEWLLFGKRGETINYMPIDILISENIDYYVNSLTL